MANIKSALKARVVSFSPTGSTRAVLGLMADAMAGETGGKADEIDLSDYYGKDESYRFSANELVLIGVPSYGGRVPAPAVDRLRRLQGNGAMAVLVVVYGNRAYEDTLLELKNIALECGFVPVAAAAFVAEHSIVRTIANGRPDANDREEIAQFAKSALKMAAGLENPAAASAVEVPGNAAYREFGGVPIKPKANKKCIRCGLCAEKCPVNAIPKENPSETDAGKCISCMRCVMICPKDARAISKPIMFALSKKLEKACAGHRENELFL